MKEADAAFSALVASGVPEERIVWVVRNPEYNGTFDGNGNVQPDRKGFLKVQKDFNEYPDHELFDWKLMDGLDVDGLHEFLHYFSREDVEGWAQELQVDIAFSVLVESGVPPERIMWGVRNTALEDGTFDGIGVMLGGREAFRRVQKKAYDWRLIDCFDVDSQHDFLHGLERERVEQEALQFQMKLSAI